MFEPGFDIAPTQQPMGFVYGPGCFGPEVEVRKLDAIRKSLRNPDCDGPEDVYAIAMDVGKKEHLVRLQEKMLLFGVVTYAAGRLGDEPVRSQGHVHAISPHCGWSTPEVYEIWSGKAIIYMQESAKDDPGRCFAVLAGSGDVVIVPPYWAHATISADAQTPLTFGAWCDRQYGFEYADVRSHGGLAWFPLLDQQGQITWVRNERYQMRPLKQKTPRHYTEFGLEKGLPIYTQFEREESRFDFVVDPASKEMIWKAFTP